MQKIVALIRKFVEFLKLLFSDEPLAADVGNAHLLTLKTGLEMANQTAEVQDAKKRLQEIQELPPTLRKAFADDVLKIQKLVERETKAKKPATPEAEKSLLDKIKEAEEKRDKDQGKEGI